MARRTAPGVVAWEQRAACDAVSSLAPGFGTDGRSTVHEILYFQTSLVVLRVPMDTWQCKKAAGQTLGIYSLRELDGGHSWLQ